MTHSVINGEVSPKVAILVINYNGKKWLEPCFSSLVRTEYKNVQLYLVDNASTDNSVELVKKRFPNVIIIQHDRNYGFAEGYNRAVRLIECDYVVLLNNDTQVLNSDWINQLVNAIEKDGRIAAVACKMLSMENPKILDCIGGGVYWWNRGVPIGFSEEDRGQYDNPPIEPFAVCGGATLIRRDAFLDVDGFDSAMFAFYEDTDVCWRLRLKGYRIQYVPSAVVLHWFSGTWGPKTVAKAYLGSRNFLRSMLKNYSFKSLMSGLPTYFLYTTTFRILGYLFWFRKPLAAWATLKGLLWNVTNLPDTLRERRKVQSTRIISDEKIYLAMGTQSREPLYQMLAQANKVIGLHSRRRGR
jgi:hypothetical protein